MTASAPTDLERRLITAAVLWVGDQGCSLALACLEQAVADYLAARTANRIEPADNPEGGPTP